MKNGRKFVLLITGLMWMVASAEFKFEPHVVHTQGGNWGKTGVGDFDNDGNLDFAAGVAGKAAYWFRNPGTISGKWERYEFDASNGGCVGGDAADVDGDGLIDWVSHGMWYRNNGKMTEEKPEKYTFNSGGMPGLAKGCHDLVVVDIDGDGNMDAMNHGISWWRNPGGDNATKTWERTDVDDAKIWGGIAPGGYGDIDGDGDMDIVGVKKWYSNLDGNGKEWKQHVYTTWGDKGKYGWEFRVVTADFDGDGDRDIAVAEGDSKDGTAAWIENVDGKGIEWSTHELPFGGVQGDMHSIGAQDFDNDGDMDISVPKNGGGENNEWLIFENVDGKGNFKKHEVYKGFGAHETVFGDFDGDGDVDIVSKCWCGKANIVLLENKLEIKAPEAPGNVIAAVTPENNVEITWEPPTGTGGNLKYVIYRNNIALDTVATATTFTDIAANGATPNSYAVSAMVGSKEGEKSAPQGIVSTFSMETLKEQLSFKTRVSQSREELEVISNVSGEFKIELYNTQGGRIAYQSGTGSQAGGIVPLRAYKNGIYIVRLTVPQGSVTQNIILSR